MLFHQKTVLCCMLILFHVKRKQPCLDQTQMRCISEIHFQNQHQVIMPSWSPKVPSWLRKNALCLSQSAFSNFAPYMIKSRYNDIKHSWLFIISPNISKLVKNFRYLSFFPLFGNVVRHCLSCLINNFRLTVLDWHKPYPLQTTRKKKTVFDLKQRWFNPRGSQKLTPNKIWYP